MPTNPIKVLILCTGNSSRSIMAEAMLNDLGQGRFQAWSAGSFPSGYVHPRSIETLKRHGVDPGQPTKLHWSTPDPAKVPGSEADTQAAFDRTFYLLKERIEQLVATTERSGKVRSR